VEPKHVQTLLRLNIARIQLAFVLVIPALVDVTYMVVIHP